MKTNQSDKSSNPYQVPSGYFDELHSEITQRTASKPTIINVLIQWIATYKRPVFATASLAFVLIAGISIYRVQNQSSDCVTLACIEKKHLINEAEEYDLSDVLEYTVHDTLTDTSASILLLQEIDESELLNEL